MSLPEHRFRIGSIPAVLWGQPSDRLTLYLHGQGGSKEETRAIADLVCDAGEQLLGVDLPEHGERQGSAERFDPWQVIPELREVLSFAAPYREVSLFAVSIGAWFALQSLADISFSRCLFVSPVVDMERLITKMMCLADVTPEQLQKERIIETSFGQTLSYDYREYVLSHPIERWQSPTAILYGERDSLVDLDTVTRFAERFGSRLTVMPGGEHWFHTESQMKFLRDWTAEELRSDRPR